MLNIKKIVALAALIIYATTSYTQTPTFHLDVAPIIYNNCTKCHRVGELGPMSLTTYDEVAANGYYIEYVTQTGYMPPWTPDHNYTTLIG
ncbi:MAG: cytochrome c, partial [Flavobacteriales bacterium]|nr:cytochrome c [Flavobacteriales bacterium]